MVGTVIKSIVSQGKRVIIPDFGAFLIKDSSLNPIITKENVTFSPFLRYNDGFLESELAHAEGLHKDEASAKLTDFIQKIKIAIFDNESVFQIDGLGYFFKDGKGNAAFSVDKPPHVGSELAGVSNNSEQVSSSDSFVDQVTLQTDSLDLDVVIPAKEKEEIKVAVEAQPDDLLVNQTSQNCQIREKREKEEKVFIQGSSNNVPPSRKFSRSLLVVFLVLIVSLLIVNVFWGDIVGTNTDASKPKIILDPLEPEQIEAEKDKLEKQEKIQSAIDKEIVATVEKTVKAPEKLKKDKKEETNLSKKEVVKKSTDKKVANDDGKLLQKKVYVLVLGSFGTVENAEKHLQTLSKKNIKGKIITKNKKSSVISKDFKTYEDAQAEQARVKSLGFDGWITQR